MFQSFPLWGEKGLEISNFAKHHADHFYRVMSLHKCSKLPSLSRNFILSIVIATVEFFAVCTMCWHRYVPKTCTLWSKSQHITASIIKSQSYVNGQFVIWEKLGDFEKLKWAKGLKSDSSLSIIYVSDIQCTQMTMEYPAAYRQLQSRNANKE